MIFTGLDVGHLESHLLAKLSETTQASMSEHGDVFVSPELESMLRARARQMSTDIVAQVVKQFDECCEQLEELFYEQSAEHSCLLAKEAAASEASGIEGDG